MLTIESILAWISTKICIQELKNEAIAKIEELTGIKRSPTQTHKFLKAIGMRILKVGVVPEKADPIKQEGFKKKS